MPFPEGLEWNQPGVEPTQAKKDEGWLPEEKPPAEYFNWFFSRMCQAAKHLKESNQALFWQPTKVYAIGDITYSPTLPSYAYLECIVAGTTAATEPTWSSVGSMVTDGTVTWIVRDIKNTGGVSIGTIMPFLATKAQPGWLACDTGALVSRTTYPDLWAWVQANAPLISETDWQTQAATQSSVGYYSTGDGSTTFRLPKILDYVRGGLQADVGIWQGDAIRNITGNMTFTEMINYVPSTGVFKGTNTASANNARSPGQTGGSTVVTFDASSVVPTADENRPKTIKFLYCVKAFDAPTNQGMIDITELANEKADINMSNITDAGKSTILNNVITSDTNYIKFADGTLIQRASTTLVPNATVMTNYKYSVGQFTFPLAFVDTKYTAIFIHNGYIPIMFTEFSADNSKTKNSVKCTAVGIEVSTSGQSSIRTDLPWVVGCTAIGRWK